MPLTLGVDDYGRVVMSTYPERTEPANIRRDPAVSVVVLPDKWPGPWAQVDGDVEVLDLTDSVEPLVVVLR